MFRLYDYKPCNESYLLEYINVLAEEMLNPNYINLKGSKRKGMKLLPARKFDMIGKNSDNLKGSKRKRMKLTPSKKIDMICENNGPISFPPPPSNNM